MALSENRRHFQKRRLARVKLTIVSSSRSNRSRVAQLFVHGPLCNVDERTAILTLLCCLNRVPIERQNIRPNIESARMNRIAVSRVLGDGTKRLVRWK